MAMDAFSAQAQQTQSQASLSNSADGESAFKQEVKRHLVDSMASSSSPELWKGWLTSPPLPSGTSRMLRVSAIVPRDTYFTLQANS